MNQKVLIVDDQEDLRRILRLALSRGDYSVLEAVTGAEALALCNAEHPDVIMLDVMMPGMHGFEVCGRIRHSPWAKQSTPYIVVISALDQPDAIAGARAVGADAYVVKPYSPVRLVEIIESRMRSAVAIPVLRTCR
jgi:CheY-like chemotaxis protein